MGHTLHFRHEEEWCDTHLGRYWLYRSGDGCCLRFRTDEPEAEYQEINACAAAATGETVPTDWPCMSSAREVLCYHHRLLCEGASHEVACALIHGISAEYLIERERRRLNDNAIVDEGPFSFAHAVVLIRRAVGALRLITTVGPERELLEDVGRRLDTHDAKAVLIAQTVADTHAAE
jgi:hypothetical protein